MGRARGVLNRVAERRDLTNKAAALETRLKAAEGSPLLIGETPRCSRSAG